MKKQKLTSGFTLIELIIYVALTITMLAVIGGMGVSVLESKTKAQLLYNIHYNAYFAFKKIVHTAESAESISSPTYTATSSVLSFTLEAQDKNPTVFSVFNGVLMMTQGAHDPIAITEESVFVRDFTVRTTSQEGFIDSAQIEMVFSKVQSSNQNVLPTAYDFSTTVVLKK